MLKMMGGCAIFALAAVLLIRDRWRARRIRVVRSKLAPNLDDVRRTELRSRKEDGG